MEFKMTKRTFNSSWFEFLVVYLDPRLLSHQPKPDGGSKSILSWFAFSFLYLDPGTNPSLTRSMTWRSMVHDFGFACAWDFYDFAPRTISTFMDPVVMHSVQKKNVGTCRGVCLKKLLEMLGFPYFTCCVNQPTCSFSRGCYWGPHS